MDEGACLQLAKYAGVVVNTKLVGASLKIILTTLPTDNEDAATILRKVATEAYRGDDRDREISYTYTKCKIGNYDIYE